MSAYVISQVTPDAVLSFCSRIAYDSLPAHERDIHYILASNKQLRGDYLGVYPDNVLAGVVHYYSHSKGFTHIASIFIDPRYRRRRLAVALVTEVVRLSPLPIIHANPYVHEAERMFLRAGFRIEPDFDPDDDNSVVFRK